MATAAGFALIAVTLTSTARAGTAVATTVPLTFTDTNICVTPAEVFTGMGELHMLVSSNLSPSGMAQSHLHADLAGLHATTVTGKKYEVPSSFNQSYEVDSFDAAPFHTTLEFLVQYIRVGEDSTYVLGDDFYEHYLAHATVNANGTLAVDDFSDDTRCH